MEKKYKRGRKLTFNALKGMEGMYVLVHDLEMDIYDQLCYIQFSYVPVTDKTREITNTPIAKRKGKGAKKFTKSPIAIREIHLLNEEYKFVYDFLGRCVNGEFECYAPVEVVEND